MRPPPPSNEGERAMVLAPRTVTPWVLVQSGSDRQGMVATV